MKFIDRYEPNRLLRLAAGRKPPGRGWLEFRVAPLGDGERSLIRQTATFDPRGVTGRLYQLVRGSAEDRVEFAAAGRGLRNRFAVALIRSALTLAFAHRHRVVRASVGRARRPATSRWAAAAVALAVAATLQPATARAQTPAAVRTVPFVDLDRYAGDWFEISRFPNRFQRLCGGDVRASYARRADGRLDVVNQCRTDDGGIQARGIARVVDDRTFARLKVRFAPAWLAFLPFVWGDYWIIGLADDYSWAVVGSPDREYLWILARTPRLDEESAAAARGVAHANGFDVERLIETAQEGNQR